MKELGNAPCLAGAGGAFASEVEAGIEVGGESYEVGFRSSSKPISCSRVALNSLETCCQRPVRKLSTVRNFYTMALFENNQITKLPKAKCLIRLESKKMVSWIWPYYEMTSRFKDCKFAGKLSWSTWSSLIVGWKERNDLPKVRATCNPLISTYKISLLTISIPFSFDPRYAKRVSSQFYIDTELQQHKSFQKISVIHHVPVASGWLKFPSQ